MEDLPAVHRYEPGRPHWWQWPTVLSLDAPLVAIAWQIALARSAGVNLAGYHIFILGASVWLAYAADRWIEGWRLTPDQVLTQRLLFHQRWRWPVAGAWIVVLGFALVLSFARLTHREFFAGLAVLGCVLVYLLSHQLVHRHHPWRAPKEICVALLLTGGVACFPAAQDPAYLLAVAAPLALFGVLCFANCALISLWENEIDRQHGQNSLVLQYPAGRPFVRAMPWILAGIGIVVVTCLHLPSGDVTECAVASSVLLGVVDLAHHRLGRQLSRVLADIVLLTPLILLLCETFLEP